MPGIDTTTLQRETARRVQRWHGVTFSARAGLARRSLGKSARLGPQYDRITGGAFFGEPRRDDAIRLDLERPVARRGMTGAG